MQLQKKKEFDEKWEEEEEEKKRIEAKRIKTSDKKKQVRTQPETINIKCNLVLVRIALEWTFAEVYKVTLTTKLWVFYDLQFEWIFNAIVICVRNGSFFCGEKKKHISTAFILKNNSTTARMKVYLIPVGTFRKE